MAQLWDPFFAETRNFQSLSPGPEEYWRERGSLSRFNLQIKTVPPILLRKTIRQTRARKNTKRPDKRNLKIS